MAADFDRLVPMPPFSQFGCRVPALIVYDDAGEPADAFYGADIQTYLSRLAENPVANGAPPDFADFADPLPPVA